MRLNYYRFPETAEEHTLLENGCAVIIITAEYPILSTSRVGMNAGVCRKKNVKKT